MAKVYSHTKQKIFIVTILLVISLSLFHPSIRNMVDKMTNYGNYSSGENISLKQRAQARGTKENNSDLLLTINSDYGRLGNKMFKYASLLGIAKKEGRIPFVEPYTHDFNMENCFNLTHVHKIDGIQSWPTIRETEYAYYDPVFSNLNRTDLKLYGYVQSWKYFKDMEDVIRQEFTLRSNVRLEAEKIMKDIRNKFPENGQKLVLIGVHVRRRDRFSQNRTCEAPVSFFTNAFKKMQTLLPGQRLVFVIAGNELKWCEDNLSGKDKVVLKPASLDIHFAVLSSCSHFVVSVGSFSWWAGWLTRGYVIYYKKFPLPDTIEAVGFHAEDYYPPSWIPVDD